ncbi:MAG: nucleoside deaminase [Gammaproteobacteria bacterium]
MKDHKRYIQLALVEAKQSYNEGGVPVGSIMVEKDRIIARGHNQRVQKGDPTAHGEMDCIRNAGRRPGYKGVTLYTTLSPCMMCTGTILQFGIEHVVIGENRNFEGNIKFLDENRIRVTLLDDPECAELMTKFIQENPRLWNEDIARE